MIRLDFGRANATHCIVPKRATTNLRAATRTHNLIHIGTLLVIGASKAASCVRDCSSTSSSSSCSACCQRAPLVLYVDAAADRRKLCRPSTSAWESFKTSAWASSGLSLSYALAICCCADMITIVRPTARAARLLRMQVARTDQLLWACAVRTWHR